VCISPYPHAQVLIGGHDVGSPPTEVEVEVEEEEEEVETETQAERISEAAFSIKEASTTRPIDKSMIPRKFVPSRILVSRMLDPRNKK
jgi:hypothetical protein